MAPTRRTGCLPRLALALGALGIAYVIGLLLVPPVLTATRTTLLIAELVELPVRPLSLVTAEPRRETTTYGARGDRLDVYLPAEADGSRARPGVVLGLGVHPQPLDSPDIVRIASAMARIGVVVAVPDSTALRELDLRPDEPAHLADAVLALRARPEVDPARVGLAGFSAGGSIALVAAADPRIAHEITYVSAFGAYADPGLLLVDVASRSVVVDGEVVAWAPDAGITRDLRTLVGRAAGSAVAEQLFAADSREQARGVVERLPESVQRDLTAVSPLAHAEHIEAPVFLLHGATDTAIAIGHARLLEEALGERVARLTTFGQFGHGQPGEGGLTLDDAADLWALLLHLHDIVAATTE